MSQRWIGQEATPERTTFVRFRKALVTQALDKALFHEITAQLKASCARETFPSLLRVPARNTTQSALFVPADGKRRGSVALSLDPGPSVLRYSHP
jgi:hypothetical protein